MAALLPGGVSVPTWDGWEQTDRKHLSGCTKAFGSAWGLRAHELPQLSPGRRVWSLPFPISFGETSQEFQASQWSFGTERRHCASLSVLSQENWSENAGSPRLPVPPSPAAHRESSGRSPMDPTQCQEGGTIPHPSPSLSGSHCPWQVEEGEAERDPVFPLLPWDFQDSCRGGAALPELFAFCHSPSLRAVGWLYPACFPVLWAGRTEPEQWPAGSTHGFSSSLINRIWNLGQCQPQ